MHFQGSTGYRPFTGINLGTGISNLGGRPTTTS
jgi:hypothetical protein